MTRGPRDADTALDATAAVTPSALDATAASTPRPVALDETAVSSAPATSPTVTPGQFPETPAARYELRGEVGRGGIGRVLEARDRVLDREVAIKELHGASAAERARFVREALITARLQHPAIVPVYEAGRWPNGAPYYAMKLVGGRPLASAIADAGTLAARLALVPVVLAVADAIAYAHSKSIVHRDLKPGNVLVGEFGETIVIDWGLAKDLSIDDRDALDAGPYRSAHRDETMVGSLLGTPAYMAPEQAAGEEVDARADVYALGAILYHLVAGASPHEGDTLDAVIAKIVKGDIAPIEQREPHVPPDLAAVIRKAMHVEAAARYPTAKELADDLRRFLAGQLVGSYRYSRWQLVQRFLRRHRGVVTAVAVACVIGVVGGTFAVLRILEARDLANEERGRAETARATAEERADRLAIGQARLLADSDPARAIALVKPLATRYWREARAIGAAARARGVARAMPIPPMTFRLAVDRTGNFALTSSSSDRIVRMHDLVRHTTTELGTYTGSEARFVGDDHLAIIHTQRIAITDRAGKPVRTIDVPGKGVAQLEVRGTTGFWIDLDHHQVWRADLLAGTPPVTLGPGKATKTKTFHVSPDGRVVVVSSTDDIVRIIGRETLELPASALSSVAWSTASDRAIIVADNVRHDISLGERIAIAARAPAEQRHAVALVGDRVYAAGDPGLVLVAPEPRPIASGQFNSLVVVRDCVIALGYRNFVLACPDATYQLARPPGLGMLAAAEGRLVSLATDLLYAWDLDALRGRDLGPAPSQIVPVGAHDVVVTDANGTRELDLQTGATHSLGLPDGRSIDYVTPHSSGALLAIDKSKQVFYRPRGGQFRKIEHLFPVEMMLLPDEHRGLLVLGTGSVVLFDGRTGKVEPLVAAFNGWFAMTSRYVAVELNETKQIWHRDLTTGATVQLATPLGGMVLLEDGRVVFSRDSELLLWNPTAGTTTELLAKAPRKITSLGVDSTLVLFTCEDSSSYRLDVAAPGRPLVALATPLSPQLGWMRELSLVFGGAGRNLIVDPLADLGWPLPGDASPRWFSNDGTLLVGTTGGRMRVWPVTLPGDAAATVRWLDALTNATTAGPTSPLVWR